MGHYYQGMDRHAFDYSLQMLPGLEPEAFRGPSVDRTRPYIACVGAAQTFGRFCARPFPTLLGDRLGIATLNLGVGGVGPLAFQRPAYLDYINGAELVVLQVLSGRSEGNSFFDNRQTGSLQGIRVSDGRSMRFEEFLDDLVRIGPRDDVERAVRETRENYVAHTIALVKQIRPPTVLFWWSTRSPEIATDYATPWAILGPFPQLVNGPMVREIQPHAAAYVECVSSRGLPQALWSAEEAIDGTTLEDGVLINSYYPSPEMHADAARALAPVCERLLTTRRPSGAARAAIDAPAPTPPTPSSTSPSSPSPVFRPAAPMLSRASAQRSAALRKFLIVSAERTGSTVLQGLLDSHSDCLVAGELFNPSLIEKGRLIGVPEAFGPDALVALRHDDPVAFLHQFFALADAHGKLTAGFKFMYGHGDKLPAVRDAIVADTSIDVIHLKRRNLLRRYVSEERALATGLWGKMRGERQEAPPPVRLSFARSVWDFAYIEDKQEAYDELLAAHRRLELTYEELETDPCATGQKAIDFLGLPPGVALEVRQEKTGVDSLRSAIVNYDELKARVQRWAAFFEE